MGYLLNGLIAGNGNLADNEAITVVSKAIPFLSPSCLFCLTCFISHVQKAAAE